jgi:hypothetical protein
MAGRPELMIEPNMSKDHIEALFITISFCSKSSIRLLLHNESLVK